MFLAIVPAYNVEKYIGSVVRSLFQHVDNVVVVDDGSVDRTGEIAKAAGATVLGHRVNRGQGAALETGHEYARDVGADFVVHFDGDGQFDVSDIQPALTKLQESGADILFGSRFLDNRSLLPWSKRYILLPLGRRLVDRCMGAVALSDSHNGFRILSRRALEKIIITQDRMAHASEIPALVGRHGLRYVEFPVQVTYHEYGQGLIGGLKILRELLLGQFVK